MTKLRLLFLMVFLLIPAITFAQTSQKTAIAEKSWNAFWMKFRTAVKTKNRAAIKAMALQKDFEDGTETVDDWLRNVDTNNWWYLVRNSVDKGTGHYRENGSGRPARQTRDHHLHFVYTKNGWRFKGPTPPE